MRILIAFLVVLVRNSHSIPLRENVDLLKIPSYIDDESNYRLNEDITVTNYLVELTLYEDIFDGSSKIFQGKVGIHFSANEKLETITLHSSNDYINIIEIFYDEASEPLKETEYNNNNDRLTIKKEVDTLKPHTLEIHYNGSVSTTDMYGLYRSEYVNNDNQTIYLLTTQFEPTYARRVFPCFDEPAYKAHFDIRVTHPKKLGALGNAPVLKINETDDDAYSETIFRRTQTMSTYLIALIVSDFSDSPGEPIGGSKYAVWSRKDTENSRKTAVDMGPKLLEHLGDYNGFPYDEMHDADESNDAMKMDQVAIPDFAAGAMENWGLVTYRETALLWDEEESSNRYKQRVETVIAHEFAHMWFGDLVTLKWWSETFLNEGFATYFEYHITAEVEPTWEMDKQFVIEVHQAALKADSKTTSTALQSEANSDIQSSNKFDTISYDKGGSIFRMVEHIITTDLYKKGLQKYISDNKYKNTEPEDLWKSFESVLAENENTGNLPEEKNLTDVMANWVIQPGHPVVSVSLSGDNVVLKQQRYLLDTQDKNSTWYIPISYTLSTDENKFRKTTPKMWLTPEDGDDGVIVEEFNKSEHKWIILNNQETGFYRVNYDTNLWKEIAAVLNESHTHIHEINRAQIVDDAFNLAKIEFITYEQVFNIIEFLKDEESYYTWYSTFQELDYLLTRVGNSDLGTLISENFLGLMEKLYKSVPFSELNNEDQMYTHKQVLALTWACKLGDEDCIKNSKEQFAAFKNEDKIVDPNLRSIVYCNALRNSENIKEDWDFLFGKYTSVIATEQITLLGALGCTTDKDTLKIYLTKSINDSVIRKQDATYIFQGVINGNPEGVDTAFDFLVDNHENVAAAYKGMNALSNVMGYIAAKITTDTQIQKLQDFIEKEGLDAELKTAAEGALVVAKANVALSRNVEKSLSQIFTKKPSGGGAEATTYSLGITVFFGIICLIFN